MNATSKLLNQPHATLKCASLASRVALAALALLTSNRALASPADLFVSQPSDAANDGSIIAFSSLGQRSTFASGLSSFVGDLAFDSTANLFEVDHTSTSITDTIYKIGPSGARSAFASATYLEGIAFNKAGDLFAAKSDGNGGGSIIWFAPDGSSTTFVTGLTSPAELAFDASGNLFLSEGSPANQVLKFAADGTQSIFASGLFDPTGIAFDQGGNLFVADQSSGKVLRFTTTGTQSTFGTAVQPIDVAFDAAGNLFVSDYNNGLVQNGGFIYKFAPDGTRTTFASGIDPTFIAYQAVPEPSSGALVALCLFGLTTVRRRF